jgi:hypothetical protein
VDGFTKRWGLEREGAKWLGSSSFFFCTVGNSSPSRSRAWRMHAHLLYVLCTPTFARSIYRENKKVDKGLIPSIPATLIFPVSQNKWLRNMSTNTCIQTKLSHLF